MPASLLSPFHVLTTRMESFNQIMLERMKLSANRVASATKSPCFQKCLPILLIFLTGIYISLGSTCFWFFESHPHEMIVRKWYMNLGVERRQFARSISSRIFNDTRNLLIIIDREQTERVQQLLVESLKRYEDKLNITPPSRREWSWISSFNFAYSLLLTVGSGFKTPTTIESQIIAIFYCLIGIPLFYFTLISIVYRIIAPVLKWPSLTKSRRFILFQLIFLLFFLWTILVGLCLYYQFINDFWLSIFTAFVGSMAIQAPSASRISNCGIIFINFSATISISLILLLLIIISSIFFPKQLLITNDGKAIKEEIERLTPPPKFQVIVDEAGESKLTTA